MAAVTGSDAGSERSLDYAQRDEVDMRCKPFEEAWQQGPHPQLVEYLAGASAAILPKLFTELLHLELYYSRKRDRETPTQNAYEERFPAYKELIAEVFAVEVQNPPVIPAYRIRKKLGKGGFGVVYLAEERELHDRPVAIKLIQPDRRKDDKLQSKLDQAWEACCQARLDHKNIVQVFRRGVEALHGPYIVFEYIDGKTLKEELQKRDDRRLPVPDAVRIAAGIADAISHAHDQGVIHRDLKPANILLDRAGKAHVTDFGLAIHEFSRRWSEGQPAGTPCYVAPEQWDGKPESASDVWALGVILYEMLTGELPFQGPMPDDYARQSHNDNPDPPSQINGDVKSELNGLCLKCLEKSPQDRITAKQLAQKLQTLADATAKGVWLMPHGRNPFFTGRTTELQQLADRLSQDSIAAIVGLGGLGKTQIVVEYVHTHKSDYRHVFWIAANPDADLTLGFLQIANRLELRELRTEKAEEVVEAVKRWLDQNANWLLIFDSADDPSLLRSRMPTRSRGHVIVTSRSPSTDYLGIANPIRPMDLTEDESIDFFEKRTHRRGIAGPERNAAAELAKELGYLPLALEQAGAYIYARQSSFQDYLTSFRRRRLELLAQSEPTAADYSYSVATTWSLSFDRVEQASPASADLLRLSAFLSPDGIPNELLIAGRRCLGANIEQALEGVEDDPVLLGELFEPLSRYSLITRDGETETYSVHRLVQEVVVAEMRQADQVSCLKQLAEAFAQILPSNPTSTESWGDWEKLLAHLQRVLTFREELELASLDDAVLHLQAAAYLNVRQREREAEALVRRAVFLSARVSDQTPHGWALACVALAQTLSRLANLQEAEQLAREVLAIGRDGNISFRCISFAKTALAIIARYQGDFVSAVKLNQEALLTLEQDPDASFHDRLGAIVNTAKAHMRCGQIEQASTLLEQIRERSWESPEDLDLSVTIALLQADIKLHRKESDQAKVFIDKAFEMVRATSGEDDLDMAWCLDHLGTWHRDSGHDVDAVSAYARTVDILERHRGTCHPDTVDAYWKLANAIQGTGDLAKAEKQFLCALDAAGQLAIPGTSMMIHCMASLAAICSKRGQDDQADEWLERALTTAERAGTFGYGYSVLVLVPQFAKIHQRGNSEMARRMLERSLVLLEATSGVDERAILACVIALGGIALDQGRYSEAHAYFLRGAETQTNTTDPYSRELMDISLAKLALLKNLGQCDVAIRDMEQAFGSERRSFDADHPDLTRSKPWLADDLQNDQADAQTSPTADMRVGRNQVCPFCNSGKKYKNCCMRKRRQT